LTQMFHQPVDHTLRLAKHEEVVSPREIRQPNDAMIAHSERKLGAVSPSARQNPDDEGFDCYAGLNNWEAGWSDLKKDWCCRAAGVGCRAQKQSAPASAEVAGGTEKAQAENKSAPANEEGPGATEKSQAQKQSPPATAEGPVATEKAQPQTQAPPTTAEGVGTTEKAQAQAEALTSKSPPLTALATTTLAATAAVASNRCVTVEDSRASHPFYQTSPPGTPCVFGVDADDEGSHCIYDGGQYGSFGWCFTSFDRSTWGSCGPTCPFSGYQKLLADKIDNLTQMTLGKQCCGGANADNKAANGTDVDKSSGEN